MNWYYEYDKDTGAYIRAVRTAEQPENTATTPPEGFLNPVYDTSTRTWTGDSQAAWLEAQKKVSAEQLAIPNADQQVQANLMLQIANLQAVQIEQDKTNSSLVLQIAQLQKGGN